MSPHCMFDIFNWGDQGQSPCLLVLLYLLKIKMIQHLVHPIPFPSSPPGSEALTLSSCLKPVQSLNKSLLRVYYGPTTLQGPGDAAIEEPTRT